MKKRNFIISLLLAAAIPAAFAQSSLTEPVYPDGEEEEEVEEEEVLEEADEDQDDLRQNIVDIPEEADDIDIPIPSFIRTDANHIILNGADWKPLVNAFTQSASAPVSIVQIGDSHVQADINSGTTRELLQYDFGDAGRGLIAPLKLSGTNEPTDYVFQSTGSWTPNKLMSSTWRQTVGFTGCSIRPNGSTNSLTLGTSTRDDYSPFSSLTIFHSGKMSVTGVRDENGRELQVRVIPSRDYTNIILPSEQTKVTVDFNSAGDLTVFGASLSGDRPGVFYHAIGNNGAAYETYNRIGNVGAGLNPLHPNLVIISLGTNEAFGRYDSSSFKRSIDRLVTNIRTANPNAQILLTTPMECQRSHTTVKKVTVRSKGKTRKGKRSKGKARTVNRTIKSYAVNSNIAPIRQAILDYGRENNIAVYDWYQVAGGSGASNRWISDGLFAGDRIHHTHRGYNLEGRLLYEAIMDTLREMKK